MRALLVTLLLLALLVVGLDVGGRLFAESQASDAIATRAASSTKPDVDIHGFSFLAQAFPGRYPSITVSTTGVTLGPVAGVDAVVDLAGVTLPLSDALSGSTEHLTADEADIRAEIPISSVTAALARPGLALTAAPNGSLRVTTAVTVAGQSIPVSADLGAAVTASGLKLTLTGVQAAGFSLPAAVQAQLTRDVTLTIPLTNLPVRLTSGTVTAAGDDLTVTAQVLDLQANALQ